MVQTSFGDFSQICAVTSGIHVSDLGGGAITLAASFADDFNGAALDASRCIAGTWAGGAYAPTQNVGILTIMTSGGGWVRSVPSFTHGVIEVTAQFRNAPYQHIGFGSDQFSGNRYFIFSTYTGDGNLYARVNNNVSEQNANLGPIPTGQHRYRIDWSALDGTTDQVTFYLDGSQVAAFTVTNSGASGFYLYLSNGSATVPLMVDAAQVSPTYLSSGTYTSCVQDAGSGNYWRTVSWDPNLAAGTGLVVEAQTSSDGIAWSAWKSLSNNLGSALEDPQRYLQYRLTLSSTNNQITPLVNSVTSGY